MIRVESRKGFVVVLGPEAFVGFVELGELIGSVYQLNNEASLSLEFG